MKGRRLILVGLLVSLLITPVAWADDSTAGQDEGVWSFDWLRNVVSWVQTIIEGPDPIPQNLDPFEGDIEAESVQSDTERSPAIDPLGNTAK